MKIFYSICVLMLCCSCFEKSTTSSGNTGPDLSKKIKRSSFQEILDSAKLDGSILIYDFEIDQYYSNDFDWAEKGQLPASTFKIVNSIIALETGEIESEATVSIWNGEPRSQPVWEQDLSFRDAFQFSCVPCYQEVARNIGAIRMKEYLLKLEYGDLVVDSSNIDMFWLQGDSRVSQFQQIDFLRRFYEELLPISQRTSATIKRMMLMPEGETTTIYGKTGWSITEGNSNGWYVGYIIFKDKVYFFAANVKPQPQFDMRLFSEVRKTVIYQAIEEMQVGR